MGCVWWETKWDNIKIIISLNEFNSKMRTMAIK